MIRQFELVERVQSYDPDADEDMLNRAYVYGLKKHGTQLRASGDPYFSHPVEVAGILAEMKLDQDVLKDKLISGMQKHADIDKPEEVNEMAELEQELAAALAQGGAEAAQPKALPMAEEDDITE